MSSACEIVDYHPNLAKYFCQLNEEWISHYFQVEDVDRRVLHYPETRVIEKGGQILFALLGEACVGTVALIPKDRTVELSKMAVTEKVRGKKVGHELLRAAIEYFKSMDSDLLYLETNSGLKSAIHLYEKFGFVHKPKPFESEYSRADVYMEYQPRK